MVVELIKPEVDSMVYWLWEETEDQEVVSSNPSTDYFI